jgi:hypothetical protein
MTSLLAPADAGWNPRTIGASGDGLAGALDALQATAAAFANACIRDARVRAQYVRDVRAVSDEFRGLVRAGRTTAREAAVEVNRLRNTILDASRLASSPMGRAYATRLKAHGLTLAQLEARYARELFRRAFGALDEAEQAAVYLHIVEASGRARPAVVAAAQRVGRVGRRLGVVAVAVAAYEVANAEDRPLEAARQGVLAGAGIAGSLAVGGGAVALGVCAATAPVCVAVAAFAGAVLFAEGADLAWGATLPRPSRRR